MSVSFLPLRDLVALDRALARSVLEPILIVKHSPSCGVSAQAHAWLAEWLEHRRERVPVYLVSVREHRAVSAAIAERLGVRHESPQVLLVYDGAVRWHGSHFRVTPEDIEAALRRHLAAAPAAGDAAR